MRKNRGIYLLYNELSTRCTTQFYRYFLTVQGQHVKRPKNSYNFSCNHRTYPYRMLVYITFHSYDTYKNKSRYSHSSFTVKEIPQNE